jgi:hypothetical protein
MTYVGWVKQTSNLLRWVIVASRFVIHQGFELNFRWFVMTHTELLDLTHPT